MIRIMVVTAVLLAGVGLLTPTNGAAQVTESVEAELVYVYAPTAGDDCAVTGFAVVDDLADAALFTVTLFREVGPTLTSTTEHEFNRHTRDSRGILVETLATPDLDPGPGRIAAPVLRWVRSSLGDADADCAWLEAEIEPQYRIIGTEVIRFTPPPVRARQAAYEIVSIPIGPADDGPDGLDGCALYRFISVPDLPGVAEYEITVTIRGASTPRETVYRLAPDDFDPNPPAGAPIEPYDTPGRLGHFLSTGNIQKYGCTHALWRAYGETTPTSIRSISFDVTYERCFGREPTIVARPGRTTRGTPGNDVILGTDGNDRILGRGGNDRICSFGGRDVVRAGDGNDRIDLGSGNDRGFGQRGSDRIIGRAGNDLLHGGPGPDRCRPGPGRDRLISC